ncbi:MAG: hypothetical protein BWY76_01001 [bacterium ADurb.Bin429]|nr:MAG: hypothetical protein BWY76_01001 [bacterium ADurb.Bin429]
MRRRVGAVGTRDEGCGGFQAKIQRVGGGIHAGDVADREGGGGIRTDLQLIAGIEKAGVHHLRAAEADGRHIRRQRTGGANAFQDAESRRCLDARADGAIDARPGAGSGGHLVDAAVHRSHENVIADKNRRGGQRPPWRGAHGRSHPDGIGRAALHRVEPAIGVAGIRHIIIVINQRGVEERGFRADLHGVIDDAAGGDVQPDQAAIGGANDEIGAAMRNRRRRRNRRAKLTRPFDTHH